MWISSPSTYFTNIKNFIDKYTSENLLIISPYITVDALKTLLDDIDSQLKVTIITSWKLEDVIYGSSDLRVYSYCKEKGYFLYINSNIHLKTICSDDSYCIFGSSNITNKGLALSEKYNYELSSEPTPVDLATKTYFNNILYESILVTDRIYMWYLLQKSSTPKFEYPSLPSLPDNLINPDKDYLISSLPMSESPGKFFQVYSANFEIVDDEVRECAIHDSKLYSIPLNLAEQDFYRYLKTQFLNSPFIVSLLNFIESSPEGRYFGEVKGWIQSHCADVPVPSRRDLTGNVQVLYKWIEILSDREYVVERPSHSERIMRDLSQ